MSALILIKLILLGFLFFAIACFSLSETAVMSLSEQDLLFLRKLHPKLLKYISFWQYNSERAIASIVMGSNFAVTAVSIVSASIIIDLTLTSLKWQIIFPAAVIIITLIFSNIFPKTFARYNAVKVAPIVLVFVYLCAKIVKPLAKVLVKLSAKLVRFIAMGKKDSRLVKASEIDFLLSNENTSPLAKDFRQMARNILDFGDTKVMQVMTGRNDFFAVDIDADRNEIVKSIIDSKYSRVPVYRGDLSNIVGIIYSKDLALAWRNSHVIILQDLLRPVYYVPESAALNNVLKEFKSGHHHCAVVVDEFGLTVGIVSIEDLLEEIVGEVSDEYDEQEKRIVPYGRARQEYLIAARESVLNVNDYLKIDIPAGSYSTIGGWALTLFGKIPKKGEKIVYKNYEIKIESADAKKINRIVLRCITK
ncbi:MAG: hemolysin family protein [Elusimicrobiota bacterium]|jgi:putative hemolysin|nr:hemolysin family protein [Elusimicrobiota bacterium]